MQRVNVMRTVVALVAAGALTGASTVSGQAAGDTGGESARVPGSVQENLRKLHASNQAEIRTAQIAQKRGMSASVVELARMIEIENRRVDEQLHAAAEHLGIKLEGDAYDAALKKLLEEADAQLEVKQGQAFDEAYTALLVRDQTEDVHGNLKSWIDDATSAGNTQLADELQRVSTIFESRLAIAQRVHDLERRQSSAVKSGTRTGVHSPASTSSIGDDPSGARGTSPSSTER
jgi:predicted outer membrane protein